MSDVSNILTKSVPGDPGTGAPVLLAEAPPPAPPYRITTAVAVRIWCAFALSICIGMLAVGFILTPSPDGTGTHRELGLPPCGFYSTTGIPCPTCGCTTAVSYLAHGQPINSFLTQPFGFTVGLIAFLLIPLSLVGLVTGKWHGPSAFFMGWYWQYWLWGGIGILLVGWAYKIISVKTGHG
jgi:hypothetical protein